MRTTISTIMLLVISVSMAIGQVKNFTIKGLAKDSESGEAIAYATVILKDTLTNIKAVTTDAKGSFVMTHDKPGQYCVSVGFVGYSVQEKEVVLNDSREVNLGVFELTEGVEVGQAVVVAQLITSDIDKTTYNTAADPESQSITAMEMMRKVPMLSVDGDDNLELKGQKNFKILINGKSSAMMSSNYKEVLKSMPASSIKNIEVITNPPAKYDAEGIGGIINIITVRKTYDNYNGMLHIMGETRGNTLAGGGYIATSLGKLSMSARLFSGRLEGMPIEVESTRENTKVPANGQTPYARFVNSSGTLQAGVRMWQGALEAGYEIDTFNLVSMSVDMYMGNQHMDGLMNTEFIDQKGNVMSKYTNDTYQKQLMGSVSGNIDYQRSFIKPNRLLTASYRLEYTPNNNKVTNDITGVVDFDSYLQYTESEAWGMEHTMQLDFIEPIKTAGILEVGGKYILRPNVSESENYLNNTFDPTLRNDLDYYQHISSVYSSYQHRFKKFSLKGGVRAEYTINTGTFKQQEDVSLFNRYFDVIPYATLSLNMKPGQSLRFGYNQRLSRPSISFLNPYVDQKDPENVSTGNPNLKSSVSNVFDVTYGKYSQLGNITLSASVLLGNNSVQQVSRMLDNGVRLTTYENIGRNQTYSLYMNGAVNMKQGAVRLNLNAGANYNVVDAERALGLKNQGWGGSVTGGVYAKTWKNANVYAYAGIYFSGVELQSKSRNHSYHSIRMSQYLMNRKLQISAGVNNPFMSKIKQGEKSWGEGFTANQVATLNSNRYFTASLTWNFGKSMTQVKKARRSITNEDKMKAEKSGVSVGL